MRVTDPLPALLRAFIARRAQGTRGNQKDLLFGRPKQIPALRS